jgi:predicted nucleotidyltransferase
MASLDSNIEDKALAAVRTLSGLGTVRAAYVFGSQAEGGADRWSDIDVAVFIEGVEGWDIRRRARAMAAVMEEVGSEVEAHLFPVSTLGNPGPGTLVEYVLQHGVCVLRE